MLYLIIFIDIFIILKPRKKLSFKLFTFPNFIYIMKRAHLISIWIEH